MELTIARLANVVGNSNIGSPELIDTHRPGEFRMSRFIAPGAASEIGREIRPESAPPSRTRRPATTFRIFRPGLPAQVDLRDGRPVRVFFRGVGGDVVAASGPWRTSGDWWREDGWQHDEWDLEIHFDSRRHAQLATPHSQQDPEHAVYRLYYDSIRQSWFVRGIYD